MSEACEGLLRKTDLLSNVSEIDFTPQIRCSSASDSPVRLMVALAPQLRVARVKIAGLQYRDPWALQVFANRLNISLLEEIEVLSHPECALSVLRRPCPKLRVLTNWSDNKDGATRMLEALAESAFPNLEVLRCDWRGRPLSEGDEGNKGTWLANICKKVLKSCPAIRHFSVATATDTDDYLESLDQILPPRTTVLDEDELPALRADFATWAPEEILGVPLDRFRYGGYSLFHYYADPNLLSACLGPNPTLSETVEALAKFCWRIDYRQLRPIAPNLSWLAQQVESLVASVSTPGSLCLDPILPLLTGHAAVLVEHENPAADAALQRFKTAVEHSVSTTAWNLFEEIASDTFRTDSERACSAVPLMRSLLADHSWCAKVDLFSGINDLFLCSPFKMVVLKRLLAFGSLAPLLLRHPLLDPYQINPRTGTMLLTHLIQCGRGANWEQLVPFALGLLAPDFSRKCRPKKVAFKFESQDSFDLYSLKLLNPPDEFFTALELLFDNVSEIRAETAEWTVYGRWTRFR